MAFGQDTNYDQQNYHFYVPYALLNHRILYDVFPAFIGPTFHNPLPYLPFYWLAWNAPPILIGAFLGALHGLAYAPLYLLAKVAAPPFRSSAIGLAVLAAFSLTSALGLGELGTTLIDNLLSALVLAGLATAAVGMPRLARQPLRSAATLALLAGVPVGLAAGLKLAFAPYCVALVASMIVIPRPWARRALLATAAGGGILLGVLIAGGPWFAINWADTGNPLFPYLNQLFQSPLAAPESYRDDSSVPDTLAEVLLFPFTAVSGRQIGIEVSSFDSRVPVLYLVGAAVLLMSLRPQWRARFNAAARLLLVFAVTAYLLWLGLFAIWRYFLPVEMLTPVLIALLINPILRKARVSPFHAMLVTIVLLGAIAFTTRPADWGHIRWGQELYGVRVPDISGDSIVLMAGTAPTAFLIPFFPPAVRFIRLQGFSTGVWDTSTGLFHAADEYVRNHQNDLYLLYGYRQKQSAETVAKHFDRVFEPSRCRVIENRIQHNGSRDGPALLCLLGTQDSH